MKMLDHHWLKCISCCSIRSRGWCYFMGLWLHLMTETGQRGRLHTTGTEKKSLARRNFPSSCDWEVGCAAKQFWPFPLVRAQQVHTLKVSIRHGIASWWLQEKKPQEARWKHSDAPAFALCLPGLHDSSGNLRTLNAPCSPTMGGVI